MKKLLFAAILMLLSCTEHVEIEKIDIRERAHNTPQYGDTTVVVQVVIEGVTIKE